MPFAELLAQLNAEHEALQFKYDQALLEISSLHTCLAAVYTADHHPTLGKDTEAAKFQHKVEFEPIHSTIPPPPVLWGGSKGSDTPAHTKNGSIWSAGSGVCSQRSLRSLTPKRTTFLEFRNRQSVIKSHSFYTPSQTRAQRFLANTLVEATLVLILVSNCVVMWIGTDQKAQNLAIAPWLKSSDIFFFVLYVAEFLFRLFAFRSHVFRDKWTRLDFLVIIIDTVSIGVSFLGGLNISLFRLLRVFRVARVFKVLRFINELQLLIHGFYGAMKAVFFAVIMLEIVMLLWCFVLVEVVHPLAVEMPQPECQVIYSSMWRSHLSLIGQIVAGDSWGEVNLLIIEAYPGTAVPLFSCLITIQFAMLNLIFTVIADAAHRARDEDEQHKLAEKEKHFMRLKERLTEICTALDTDGDGELGLEELVAGFENNEDFSQIMVSLDVGREDMGTLFVIMDEDRSGSVSSVEFVNNIYRLKEQDIHTTLMFVKGYLVDLRIKVKEDVQELLAQNLKSVKATQKHAEVMVHALGRIARPSEARATRSIEPTSSEERIWKSARRPSILAEPDNELAKTLDQYIADNRNFETLQRIVTASDLGDSDTQDSDVDNAEVEDVVLSENLGLPTVALPTLGLLRL